MLSHKTLIYISGLVWLGVGFMLLRIGLNLLLIPDPYNLSTPLLTYFSANFGSYAVALNLLLATALLIGYFKGKFVLGKSARKGVERIATFPNPTHFSNIYSSKYYILLGSMIFIGMSIKYLGIPTDIRGLIDIAIGVALLTGGMVYFRLANRITCDKGNP